MEDIILIGFGGHAKSVIDSIKSSGFYRIIGYTDIQNYGEYRGCRYLGDDSVLHEYYNKGIKNAYITIGYMGDSRKREQLYKFIIEIGYRWPSIVDPTAIIAADVTIEEGVFVGKGAIINSNAKINRMAIVNTGAIVEHDCIVGEFSHVSVGSVLCGNAFVGRESFIGAKTVVIQGINIGNNVIIGAGSCVLVDIPDNCKAVGTVKRILDEA